MRHLAHIITLALILPFLFSSCDDDLPDVPDLPQAAYDTIFPQCYFPAWPGSHWTYVDSHGDTVTRSTADTFMLDFYTESAAAFVSDTFRVPVYEGTPIWGYLAHTGPISHSGSYPLTRILSDTLPVGEPWLIHNWSGTAVSRKVIVKDTAVSVYGTEYGPVIGVEEYYSQGPPTYIWIARRYYACGVGLVREDLFEGQEVNTRLLIGHHIGQ